MTPFIAALQLADTDRIVGHLLRLAPHDRSLRFAAGLVTDETIERYVRSIRFAQDAVYGLVVGDGHDGIGDDCGGDVVGFAHGCRHAVDGQIRVETAFSIDAAWRGHGHGNALMTAIESFARKTGAQALLGVCIARNLPMRRVFERAGMTFERCDDEIHASRRLEVEALSA